MAFQITTTDAALNFGRNSISPGSLAVVANASLMSNPALTFNRNAVVPFKADIPFQVAISAGTLGVLAGTVGYATS